MNPPAQIDGADELCWAWSGSEPFGAHASTGGEVIEYVFGLAICRYLEGGAMYRFGCNESWETVNDAQCDSVRGAIAELPDHYKEVKAEWHFAG
jgi:hypothetical protein